LATTRYLITGCSGGGKSSLIDALSVAGFATVPEAVLSIVQEQLAADGAALPWLDMNSFIDRLSIAAIEQFDRADGLDEPVFFDRGFIEALAYWRLRDTDAFLALQNEIGGRRYSDPVLVVPPWPELFVSDHERRHDFSDSVAEYNAICNMLNELDYRQIEVPKSPFSDRVAFILGQLDIGQKSVQ
jgi:predicted ATPase